jgi:hypothetical protein
LQIDEHFCILNRVSTAHNNQKRREVKCQGEMELVLRVKAQGLVEEWAKAVAKVVWAELALGQVPVETASVQVVAPRLLTAEECPATTYLVPNVGLKWLEDREEKP